MEYDFVPHLDIHEIRCYPDLATTAQAAAQEIIKEVKANPEISITYATGNTMKPIYEYLHEAVVRRDVDFSKTTAFHLDEYWKCAPDNPFGFVKFLKDRVFDPLKINPDNIHTLHGLASNPEEEADRYNTLLKDSVGLALLGVGPGGHIGFNEKHTPFSLRTHLGMLSIETIRRDKERGEYVSDYALTQGPANIVEAKRCLMIAYGTEKGDFLYGSLYEPVSEKNPASILRLHGDKVSVMFDREAYNQIELRKSLNTQR